MKQDALLRLARLRQSTRLAGYACISDFHDGIFECDHVSPYTKSGDNVDAAIMIVGQDWASAEKLARYPPDKQLAKRGLIPDLPTNKNLDDLLERHFGLTRADCYVTNMFPFVKQGNMSARIPSKLLVDCARKFTLPETAIVSPQIAICLGIGVFNALRRAGGMKALRNTDQATKHPFRIERSTVHCVAHTGSLGSNRRGRDKVEQDWQTIAASLLQPN